MSQFNVLPLTYILSPLTCFSKKRLFEELSALASAVTGIESTRFLRALNERESAGSTVCAKGVSIPHALIPKLPQSLAVLAILQAEVPYNSVDTDYCGVDVALAFFISPKEKPDDCENVLRLVSRELNNADLVNSLRRSWQDNNKLLLILGKLDQLLSAEIKAPVAQDKDVESPSAASTIIQFISDAITSISGGDEDEKSDFKIRDQIQNSAKAAPTLQNTKPEAPAATAAAAAAAAATAAATATAAADAESTASAPEGEARKERIAATTNTTTATTQSTNSTAPVGSSDRSMDSASAYMAAPAPKDAASKVKKLSEEQSAALNEEQVQEALEQRVQQEELEDAREEAIAMSVDNILASTPAAPGSTSIISSLVQVLSDTLGARRSHEESAQSNASFSSGSAKNASAEAVAAADKNKSTLQDLEKNQDAESIVSPHSVESISPATIVRRHHLSELLDGSTYSAVLAERDVEGAARDADYQPVGHKMPYPYRVHPASGGAAAAAAASTSAQADTATIDASTMSTEVVGAPAVQSALGAGDNLASPAAAAPVHEAEPVSPEGAQVANTAAAATATTTSTTDTALAAPITESSEAAMSTAADSDAATTAPVTTTTTTATTAATATNDSSDTMPAKSDTTAPELSASPAPAPAPAPDAAAVLVESKDSQVVTDMTASAIRAITNSSMLSQDGPRDGFSEYSLRVEEDSEQAQKKEEEEYKNFTLDPVSALFNQVASVLNTIISPDKDEKDNDPEPETAASADSSARDADEPEVKEERADKNSSQDLGVEVTESSAPESYSSEDSEDAEGSATAAAATTPAEESQTQLQASAQESNSAREEKKSSDLWDRIVEIVTPSSAIKSEELEQDTPQPQEESTDTEDDAGAGADAEAAAKAAAEAAAAAAALAAIGPRNPHLSVDDVLSLDAKDAPEDKDTQGSAAAQNTEASTAEVATTTTAATTATATASSENSVVALSATAPEGESSQSPASEAASEASAALEGNNSALTPAATTTTEPTVSALQPLQPLSPPPESLNTAAAEDSSEHVEKKSSDLWDRIVEIVTPSSAIKSEELEPDTSHSQEESSDAEDDAGAGADAEAAAKAAEASAVAAIGPRNPHLSVDDLLALDAQDTSSADDTASTASSAIADEEHSELLPRLEDEEAELMGINAQVSALSVDEVLARELIKPADAAANTTSSAKVPDSQDDSSGQN